MKTRNATEGRIEATEKYCLSCKMNHDWCRDGAVAPEVKWCDCFGCGVCSECCSNCWDRNKCDDPAWKNTTKEETK